MIQNFIISATLEFGKAIGSFIVENKMDKKDITINCDDFGYFSDPKNNPFDFFIKYIYFSLKENKYIGSLKIVYQNKKNDNLITLLETPGVLDVEELQKIEFNSYELIINMKVWVKDEILTGFEIKTIFGRNIKIGYGEKEDEIIIKELKDENCMILGFGADANSTKVTGIYCYYADSRLYDNYNFYLELHKLRVKLMLDDKYKSNILSKKSEFDDRYRFIIDVCELPNLPFFSILSYILD